MHLLPESLCLQHAHLGVFRGRVLDRKRLKSAMDWQSIIGEEIHVGFCKTKRHRKIEKQDAKQPAQVFLNDKKHIASADVWKICRGHS